jgi:RNA polymerase sigma-70 factor (ECF subfamily)
MGAIIAGINKSRHRRVVRDDVPDAEGLLAELEGLYRRDFRAFVRVAASLTGSVSLGHEAVQEAFARAIEGLGQFRGQGTLEAWVWRIVVNTARSCRRASPVDPLLETIGEPASENGHVPASPVEAWVRLLPERQRLVVFLRYWVDLDYRSIAHVLGIEVGTVSATLNAAHKTLRRSLEEVSS